MKFTFLFLIITTLNSFAADDLKFESQTSNYFIEDNLDSLLNDYYVVKYYENLRFEDYEADTLIPEFPDSVYISRLRKIPSIIPLNYNSIVRNFIHVYTVKKRDKLSAILGLESYYFPIIEEILDKEGLPTELKYMAVIESALNPTVISRAGAVGLWQFMYGTGKMYKLKMNSFVDERRDPIASTYAAAAYLKDLYKIYNDWILVIAAYNCGPGNVNKAIRRTGGKTDYWEIYYYLPRETRGYVPAFIAAIYSMTYYKEHNITPNKIEMPAVTDTIRIKENLHFNQVSELVGISKYELRRLNPQYRADIIPGNFDNAYLRLTPEYSSKFINFEDSVYNYKDSIYNVDEDLLKSPTSYSAYKPSAPSGNYTTLYYTVKSGDAVGLIADWYDVRTSDLRYWNNIRGNMIRTGQKLVIYKPKSVAAKYSNVNNLSYAQKQRKEGYTVASTSSTTSSSGSTGSGEYITYTVKSGDSLWKIAQKYEGVTETQIIRLNNLRNGSQIYPGQVLKIKEK